MLALLYQGHVHYTQNTLMPFFGGMGVLYK